jgi:hypothetical protein
MNYIYFIREYVVQSFNSSCRTYINKIMFGGFPFSIIYILQKYIGIIRQCLANKNSHGKNLSFHPSTSSLIEIFKIGIF